MRYPRAVTRIFLLFVWSLVSATVVMAARAAFFVSETTRRRWMRGAYRRWGRGMARIVKACISFEGPVPEAPFFLVTNHLSYVDIFVLSGLTGAIFVAKSEIRSWPVIGLVCRSIRTIFIDRTQRREVIRVGQEISERLNVGEGIVLFGEATTSQGFTVQPFKPSLLAPAAQLNLDVRYATLGYRTPEGYPPASDSIAWWGDASLMPHLLQLCQLPHFYATVRFGREPIRGEDRKQLARELHEAILEEFTPLTATPSDR